MDRWLEVTLGSLLTIGFCAFVLCLMWNMWADYFKENKKGEKDR